MSREHEVAGWRDGVVEFERPIEIVRRQRMRGERMVSVSGETVDLRVTEGHAIVHRAPKASTWEKSPARDRVRRVLTLPAFGEAAPCSPSVTPSPSELTAKECEFIGIWLGDDEASRFDLFAYGYLEAYLEHEGNDLLWGLDREQFRSLLFGFWRADGLTGIGRTELPPRPILHDTRKRMLDRLQAIAACRGWSTRLFAGGKRGGWSLSLVEGEHVTVRRPQLAFERRHRDELVWCVRTRAGNIVTRRRGAVVVLGNCEGWDQPSVKCAILARPTKSTGLYLQQAGRVLRPWNDERAIILDHGGCAIEHGLPHADRAFSLEGRARKGRTHDTTEPLPKECSACFAVIERTARVCPDCGALLRAAMAMRTEADGALIEIGGVPIDRAAANRGYDPSRVAELRRPPTAGTTPVRLERPLSPIREAAVLGARVREIAHVTGGSITWAELDARRGATGLVHGSSVADERAEVDTTSTIAQGVNRV